MTRLWRAAGGAIMLVLAAGASSPAVAASFDCHSAGSPIERRICADPALSSADEALGAAFAAALAASPHPQVLRQEQRDWVAAERNKAADDAALRDVYARRVAALTKSNDGWQTLRRQIASARATQCVDLLDDDLGACAVDAAGPLPGAPGEPLRYRTQVWRDGDRTTATAVVVTAGDGAATRAVTWSAEEDASFEKPGIVRSPQGPLLDLPGSLSGTGNISAESLFAWRDNAWHEVDTQAWLRQLDARLPKDHQVWKGVYPDWRTMTASTPVWRPGDGNCCPRGGTADVTLRLDGDRIVLVTLRLSPAKPDDAD